MPCMYYKPSICMHTFLMRTHTPTSTILTIDPHWLCTHLITCFLLLLLDIHFDALDCPFQVDLEMTF